LDADYSVIKMFNVTACLNSREKNKPFSFHAVAPINVSS